MKKHESTCATGVTNNKMEENEEWIDNGWFSDEAHFHLNGYINSNNNVYWGTSPPQEVLQRPLHSSKVTTWCAMNSKTIIGFAAACCNQYCLLLN